MANTDKIPDNVRFKTKRKDYFSVVYANMSAS